MIAAATPPRSVKLSGGLEFFPVAHVDTFQSNMSTFSNIYRDSDIALRNSIDNARFMRNDCGIMQALESRLRAVALLEWTVEPEDEKSPEQKQLCEEMRKILGRINRFTEFRRSLLEAEWYGKFGAQLIYRNDFIGGYSRFCVSSPDEDPDTPCWSPVNGDKIVFRHDDASRLDASRGQYPHQVGIRIGMNANPNKLIAGKYRPEKVATSYSGSEPTDRGWAYFLDRTDRQRLVIHKHTIEDGSYEDPLSAGSIHGVGIRSRIYWDWVQLTEMKAFLVSYIERTHGGMQIYRYPLGNAEAEKAVDQSIRNRVPGNNAIKVPVPMGEDASQYGFDTLDFGMGGIQVMMDLIQNYYDHRIKMYILGQTLSTDTGATGMGSGVAELHLESFLQIVKYSAVNLDDTMSSQLLRWLQLANFPASKGIRLRYKTVTEDSDQDKKLQALQNVWQMGARVKESDVFDVVGLSAPNPGDRILQSPQGANANPHGPDSPSARLKSACRTQ